MASTSSIVSRITYALYLGAGEHTALTCAKDQTMVVSMPRSPKVALATACLFLGSSDQRIWAFPRTAGLDNEDHLSTATRKKKSLLDRKKCSHFLGCCVGLQSWAERSLLEAKPPQTTLPWNLRPLLSSHLEQKEDVHREVRKNGLNWANCLGERLYCGQLGSLDSRNLVQTNSTRYYFNSAEI